MVTLFWILIAASWTVSGVLIVERHDVEFDETYGNVSTTYRRDSDGNSLTNVTIYNIKTITKGLIYFTMRLAADQFDREYKFEVVKTVLDVSKFLKGAQSNPLIRPYIESILQGMKLKITFPMKPVSAYQEDQKPHPE